MINFGQKIEAFSAQIANFSGVNFNFSGVNIKNYNIGPGWSTWVAMLLVSHCALLSDPADEMGV
jgi:hypothetical protein